MANNDLNLDILENADDNTVNRLSKSYSAVSDKDMERMFLATEKLYKSKAGESSEEYSETVSGTEIYRKPVWKKMLTAAAAFVLCAGVVTGSLFLLKDRSVRDTGNPGDISAADLIGSTEVIPYVDILDMEMFGMSYESYTSPENPLQLSGGPYENAVVARPYKTVLVDGSTVMAPLNVWHFPVVNENSYIGFINCDMRFSPNGEPSFFGSEGYAPKLNEALQKGSIALFGTVNGTYGIYEDNTVIELDVGIPSYSGNITFEQVNKGCNLITADSADDIIYDKDGKVWNNLISVPDNIFKAPTLPDELKGKHIREYEPIYEYAFDFEKIENDAEQAENLIIGTVDSISYKTEVFHHGGTPYTQIDVTVTGDIAGKVSEGDKVSIITGGGYISMRELSGENLYKTGGKYGDGINMTEEEIDNEYYHEKVFSGEVPIIGSEYAFFVSEVENGLYNSVGQEFGMLYKCENVYIQRNSSGYSFYDLEDLKAMMNSEISADTKPNNDISEPTGQVNTESDSSASGLPTFTSSSNAKKWEIIQTTQEMVDYNGNTVEKGIYAISRTDPVGKPMPAGNPQPSLRIGDEHNRNYSVSFDYCIPDKGTLFFMMYDASDTVYANDQLGEEYYWYELLANGRLYMGTTFGKNSKHICSSDGNFITVENYNPTIWNHCKLNVTDSGTEVFINDELITVLDSLNNKKTGRLGLDGIQGTMFRNIDFRD